MLDTEKIRQDFPIFQTNKNLIYFDNAATTQKPQQVLQKLEEVYKNYNANVHRSIYKIAVEATAQYEEARKKVARFINAKPEELIWTRGATEAINHVLYSWAWWNLKAGDEIVTTVMEHHSNIVPWQLLLRRGVKLRYVNLSSHGTLDMQELQNTLSRKTKLVTITHVSNVLGTINPVEEIAKIAHDFGALYLVDGAQSVPHMPVDVKEIDCDFFAFSGHKMLGPTGIGGLYAKQDLLEELEPALRGSEQIRSVTLFETTWNDLPWKFEPGTPNIADAIALGAAVDYLQKVGMKNVQAHENELTKYALQRLQEIPEMKIFGPTNGTRSGVVSFQFADVHPHDLATFLDSQSIAIRSGHMCAMPLMTYLKVPAVARISFYIYNTHAEIDKFITALEKAKEVFKVDPQKV
jgi:cysteine desulfurase/selenocysteine lyase